MAGRESETQRSRRRQSSQSVSSWHSSSSPMPDTQELLDGVEAYANQRVMEARREDIEAYMARRGGVPDTDRADAERAMARRGGVPDTDRADAERAMARRGGVPDTDGADAERASKRRKTSPTQPGRGIRKIVDLYHDLTVLFDKAKMQSRINRLRSEDIEEMEQIDFVGMSEEEIEEERKDRQRCHRALKLINILIPGFEQKAAAAENINNYCAPLQIGANDARSDDTSRLKIVMAEWLNSRSPSESTSNAPSHIPARGKDERGINHDITGYLLCPIDYDWNEPDVRAKLRNADPGYDFASSFFLRCLYEGETGDPDAPLEGFLKGPLLIRAYRHIFTAPSSASGENASEIVSRRRDVATNLGLNGHVTPRSVAYTATQLVFSLNSARDWKQEHAGFHYPSFYNFIVDFFEDVDDDDESTAVNELLQWWNSKIFPTTARKAGGAASRNALRSSQRRVQEHRARLIRA